MIRFGQIRLRTVLGCTVLLCTSATSMARADDFERRESTFVSHTGTILYLAAGVGLPLLQDGAARKNHALRALDTLGTASLLSLGLKELVREKRPDSQERDSFPSGHATAAFAIAAVESSFRPRQAALWYAGAALIAESRVSLHRHYLHDILAGAALGYGTARWELSRPRGLILTPFIDPTHHGAAIQLRSQF